jgi:arylsulfatase A-like enzyme
VGLCAGAAPNILFILVDDLGWNDVSWHNPEVNRNHLNFTTINSYPFKW